MLNSLNERLVKVKKQQRNKQKWESQLDSYQTELKTKQDEREMLKVKIASEEKDVEKLTNLSLTSLFYTLMGKKEDQLDKDKQELFSAHLKYDEVNKSIDDINKKIMALRENLNTIPNVEAEYQDIMIEKESLIADANSPLTEEYYHLSEQIAISQTELVEIKEAIHAGEAVKDTLVQAMDSLESAENWGTFDLLGGGFIATAAKHSHIDDAKEIIYQAQSEMRSFQKELSDIELNSDLDIDISGLLTFADYFFDGLISDWMVQGRIDDSLENVQNQSQQINQLISKLQYNARSLNEQIEEAKAHRAQLIENA